jgi:hypothetical protein
MDVVSVLASIAGSIISVGVIYRSVVRPLFRWGQRLDKAITTVEMHMNNNGGTSLRDVVDRIENRITKLEDYVTKPR